MTGPVRLELSAAAALPTAAVLDQLGSSAAGLSSDEARRRVALYGANVLRSHGVSALSVLVRQVRSYLLLLLLVAAVVSAVVGDRTEALIIGGIMVMSVGLSFFNEYRSEKAVEALHSQIRHLAFVDRDAKPTEVNVSEIVPGDVVHLRVGDVVPADLRLVDVHELECDESLLTGESQAAAKTADAAAGRRVAARPPLVRLHGNAWCEAVPDAVSWSRPASTLPSARSRSAWASDKVRHRSSKGCSSSRACSPPSLRCSRARSS